MKKLIVFVLTALLFLFPLAVYADDADLDVSYSGNNESIVVTVALINITDESGVAALDCEVQYDTANLEFVSATVNIPDAWKPYLKSGEGANSELCVENWSENKENGVYSWCLFSSMDNSGITSDELFITFEFKPLSTEQTVIKANMLGLYNGNFDALNCNSRNLVVKFDGEGEVVPDDSTDSGSSSNLDTDNSENEGTDIDSSNSANDEAADNNNANDSSVDSSTVVENNGKAEDNNEESTGDETDSGNINPVLFVLVVGGSIAAVTAIVVVMAVKGKFKNESVK